MIWRFGKKQLSDVVKIQQFLEKENIDYELLLDNIDIGVGTESSWSGTEAAVAPRVVPDLPPQEKPVDPDIGLWRAAEHDGLKCNDFGCKDITHFGAEAF